MLTLIAPARRHRRAFWAFVRECKRAGDHKIQGLYAMPRSYRKFLRDYENEYFLMEEGKRKILGLCYFTPGLSAEERRADGDVAYHIAPSERQKGYGTQLLALALAMLRGQGVRRACATCRKANAPSAKIITANGGVLTEEFEHRGVPRQVYWIEL